jgi:hypothetical protein
MFFSINKRRRCPAIYHDDDDDDDSAILVHVLRVRPITKARVHVVEGSERSPLYRPPARPSDCLSLSLSLRSVHTHTHTHMTRHSRRRKNAAKRISAVLTLPSVGGGAPIACSRPTRSTDLTVVRSIYCYWLHNPTRSAVVPVGPPPAQITRVP